MVVPGPGLHGVPESMGAGLAYDEDDMHRAGEQPALPLKYCFLLWIPAGNGHHSAQHSAAWDTPLGEAPSITLMK